MNGLNLPEIIAVNGIGVSLMVFLLKISSENIQRRTDREIIFNIMIWLTIIGSVAEIVTALMDGKIYPGCIVLSYVWHTICYLCPCLVAFLWCVFVDLRIFNSRYRIQKRVPYLVIPLEINAILSIINLTGSKILFSVSGDNVYQRGPLAFVVYFNLFFYLIYSMGLVDRSKKKGLFIHDFPTIYYVVPCIWGTLIQGACYGITVGWAAVASAFLFVYIRLQTMDSLVDPLSGLYNRRYLENTLEHLQENPKECIYGVMMDVNNFKKINDHYGHLVGDETIRAIGKILADSVPSCGIAIRYAGDEFVMLLCTEAEEVVHDTLRRVHENVERYNNSDKVSCPFSLSMGYDRFDTVTGDTEGFLQRMDKKMYAEKEEFHGQTN